MDHDTNIRDSVTSDVPRQAGISRRAFIRGTASALVGTVAAGAVITGAASAAGCSSSSSSSSGDDAPETLMVSEDQLVSCMDDYEQLDPTDRYAEEATAQLPVGTMLWASSDTGVIMLVPGEDSSPLSRIEKLDLATGIRATVLEHAVSEAEGYEIYDVRASATVIAWSEYAYLTSAWRFYAATLSSEGSLGTVLQLDEGDVNWDPPQFCVQDSQVFWNYLPYEEGAYTEEASYVKTVSGNGANGAVLYTSNGRLITAPETSNGLVTIVPRAEASGVYYTMTAIDPFTEEVVSTLTLPRSMRVLNAIYMDDAFTFSVEASYDTESAIGKLGTYRDLGDGNWLRVARTPLCTPAMVGGKLVVKAGKGLTVVDTNLRQFFNIAAPAYSWDYGEYLACAGSRNRILTYATVDPGNDVRTAYVLLRLISLK